MTVNFSAETIQPKKEWHETLTSQIYESIKQTNKNYNNSMQPAKLFSRYEGRIKTFLDTKHISTRTVLHKILKRFFEFKKRDNNKKRENVGKYKMYG